MIPSSCTAQKKITVVMRDTAKEIIHMNAFHVIELMRQSS
ncbi:hypothetical protein DSUL_50089 [Desulfovibrionales bacterium]